MKSGKNLAVGAYGDLFTNSFLARSNDMSQRSSSSSPKWLPRLLQGVLGVLGLYAALRLLPRVLKSMTRRFVFGLIGEILLVAIGLFLTRRATEGSSYDAAAPARKGETDEK